MTDQNFLRLNFRRFDYLVKQMAAENAVDEDGGPGKNKGGSISIDAL